MTQPLTLIEDLARNQPVTLAASAVALLGLAAIGGAWFFQLVIGLPPCPLCLEQRYAYYFAIPLAVLVLLGLSFGASRKVVIAALGAITLMMLWNAGLGAYHAGVEWKFWAGPQDCSGAGLRDLGTAGGLLEKIKTTRVIRCDEIPWSFLGLSLAGYNALISLVLAMISAFGAHAAWRTMPAPEKVT